MPSIRDKLTLSDHGERIRKLEAQIAVLISELEALKNKKPGRPKKNDERARTTVDH